MYINDSIADNQISFAAEQQGFKHIELQLDPREGLKGLNRIRIYGVKIAKTYEDGTDRETGMTKYMIKITGGFIDFIYNEKRRAWFGYLLDDKEEYNRRFLASHIYSEDPKKNALKQKKYKPGESQFIITDQDVKHDVLLLRRELDGEKVDRVPKITDETGMKQRLDALEQSNSDKDAQIAKLMKIAEQKDTPPLKGAVIKDMKSKIQESFNKETGEGVNA